jgi:hypothetical protein
MHSHAERVAEHHDVVGPDRLDGESCDVGERVDRAEVRSDERSVALGEPVGVDLVKRVGQVVDVDDMGNAGAVSDADLVAEREHARHGAIDLAGQRGEVGRNLDARRVRRTDPARHGVEPEPPACGQRREDQPTADHTTIIPSYLRRNEASGT